MSIIVRSNDPAPAATAATPLAGDQASTETPSAPEANAAEQTESEETDAPETEDEESDTEAEASTDTPAKDESENERAKKKSGSQRRKERAERAEAEVARLRKLIEDTALNRVGEPKTEPNVMSQSATVEGEPDPDHFETHREFVKAMARWEAKQIREEERQQSQKTTLETERNKTVETYQSRARAFAEKTKDFDDVLGGVEDMIVSPTIEGVILTSENGPEIAYELAKNREVFERINRLPPIAAAREIGRIEARLAAQSSDTKQEIKKTTSAPKPIDPVGKSSSGSVKKDISDPTISQADYERLRRAQMKRQSA